MAELPHQNPGNKACRSAEARPRRKRSSSVSVAIVSPSSRVLGQRQSPATPDSLVAERETEESGHDRDLSRGEMQQTAERDDRRTGQGG